MLNFLRVPHLNIILIDNFFSPEICQSILDDSPQFDDKLALKQSGKTDRKSIHEHLSETSGNFRKLDNLKFHPLDRRNNSHDKKTSGIKYKILRELNRFFSEANLQTD